MSIEALEGLTDEELFSDANADEETTEQVVAEPAPEPEAVIEQPAEPTEPVATDPLARAPVDDNAPQVPSWRVREINDEKRTLADKVAALEAEKLQWQRQQPAPQPVKEPEKVAKPDPLLDPEGYEAYLETKFEEKLLNNHRESSLANAHKTYKGEFEEAYAAAQKQVDPALKALMQQSRDPGETLIQWHREQKTRAEVGTDLTAYKAKLREEALKDPEFRKAAMEAWQAEAQPLVNGRPRVELPPSLSGASRANASLRSSNDDVDDRELFTQTAG